MEALIFVFALFSIGATVLNLLFLSAMHAHSKEIEGRLEGLYKKTLNKKSDAYSFDSLFQSVFEGPMYKERTLEDRIHETQKELHLMKEALGLVKETTPEKTHFIQKAKMRTPKGRSILAGTIVGSTRNLNHE